MRKLRSQLDAHTQLLSQLLLLGSRVPEFEGVYTRARRLYANLLGARDEYLESRTPPCSGGRGCLCGGHPALRGLRRVRLALPRPGH